ncbi:MULTISPECIES: Dabb family protein [unclassified Thalassospira]|uniref:Dabb family protein n=1 Tax=unclassified Thalassospira TaxID=2648997 RepID=UPI000A1F1AB0|nr:Dabb family protein [Thalassospira sp. MCCC 1A01428]
MIRHIVLVQVPYHADPVETAAVFSGMKEIAENVEGMLGFVGGRNLDKDGLHQGFTHAFTIDFVDIAARDAYVVGLDEKQIGHRLTKLAQGGLGGIMVMNTAINSTSVTGPKRPRKLEASWS